MKLKGSELSEDPDKGHLCLVLFCILGSVCAKVFPHVTGES